MKMELRVLVIFSVIAVVSSLKHSSKMNDVMNREDCESRDLKMDSLPYFSHVAQLNRAVSRSSGFMLNIRCAATGVPQPNITWTKDGGPIDRIGETKTRKWTLVLKNLTPNDSGHYTCTLCNIHGCIDHTTNLLVEEDEKGEEEEDLRSKNDRDIIFWLLASLLACICTIFLYRFLYGNKNNVAKVPRVLRNRRQVLKHVLSPTGFHGEFGYVIPPIHEIEGMDPSDHDYNTRNIVCAFPLDARWEIRRDQLTLGRRLGIGNSGVTFEALWRSETQPETTVVVKMLQPSSQTGFQTDGLLREIELLKIFTGRHRNIVNLLGICTQNGPLYAVLEYAPRGDLLNVLRTHGNALSLRELISYAIQVASALEYLASKNCIHRDVAARNVLVFNDNTVKISDFGLAWALQEEEYYNPQSSEAIPYHWRAPETLKNNIHEKNSDIWSFGVFVYELLKRGSTPYGDVGDFDRFTLREYLRKGNRLYLSPELCPEKLHELVKSCWKWNPHHRPSFTKIRTILDDILRGM